MTNESAPVQLRRSMQAGEWMKISLALGEAEPEISRLDAPTYAMRIGPAVVKMGGVAGVGTNDEHRRRGYARLILDESTRYFTEAGHDVAVLFGIPDFYHKFGYAPIFPVTTLRLRVEDVQATVAESLAAAYTLRPLEPDDWPAALDLYDLNHRTRTGTVLRPRESWKGLHHGTQWGCGTEVATASDDGSTVRGYVAFDNVATVCRIGDLAYATPNVFPALLWEMVRQAGRRNLAEFEVKLPPDHAFVQFCRRCGGRVETVYERNANGMGRIINLGSLFVKLADVLSERFQCSPLIALRGVLELKTDLGAVALELSEGQVRVLPQGQSVTATWQVELPQMGLMQLVMGYRGVADAMLDDGVSLPPAAVPLMETLFPIGHPWMAMTDWF